MSELNPCPQCGNEPALTVFSEYISTVVCDCGLAVDVGATTGDAAINGWNDVTANFANPVKTLRDEFAAIALPLVWNASGCNTSLDDIAALTYKMADAMVREGNK